MANDFAYGRGRIIGDYRRGGVVWDCTAQRAKGRGETRLDSAISTDDVIPDREELSEQIRALSELKQMASGGVHRAG